MTSSKEQTRTRELEMMDRGASIQWVVLERIRKRNIGRKRWQSKRVYETGKAQFPESSRLWVGSVKSRMEEQYSTDGGITKHQLELYPGELDQLGGMEELRANWSSWDCCI